MESNPAMNKESGLCPGRRGFLKNAVITSAALSTFSILSSVPTRAHGQVSCTSFVRSPWVYYPLDQSNLLADFGNESLPSLLPLSNDDLQWTENTGWWSGNGINRSLEIDWFADQVGFDSVMSPSYNAYLLGLEIQSASSPSGSEVIASMGQNLGGGFRPGLELRYQSDDKIYLYLRDDAQNTLVLRSSDAIHNVCAGNICVFVFIDNRPLGSRTAHLYIYESGTSIHVTRIRPKSISSLGEITGGPISQLKKISLGAMKTASDYPNLQFNGQLRRLNVLNYGNTPPSNIAGIMDALAVNRMQPVPELDGV